MAIENQLITEPVHESFPDFTPKRVICVPVDKTPHCASTLDWVLDTVAQPNDQIVLLHVRPTGHSHYVYGLRHEHLADHSVEQQQKLDQQYKKLAHQLLSEYAKKVVKKEFNCRAIVLVGDAREQLELKITKLKPDFVVMASKSSSILTDVFMGSVSKHVLHACHVPVLIRPVA